MYLNHFTWIDTFEINSKMYIYYLQLPNCQLNAKLGYINLYNINYIKLIYS